MESSNQSGSHVYFHEYVTWTCRWKRWTSSFQDTSNVSFLLVIRAFPDDRTPTAFSTRFRIVVCGRSTSPKKTFSSRRQRSAPPYTPPVPLHTLQVARGTVDAWIRRSPLVLHRWLCFTCSSGVVGFTDETIVTGVCRCILGTTCVSQIYTPVLSQKEHPKEVV